MKVRAFTWDDYADCLELGRQMHAESDFSVHPFSEDKIAKLAGLCIENPDFAAFVAEKDGEIVGMMAGFKTDHYFSDVTYGSDLLLYIPPPHRGSSAALRLMSAFAGWAASVGCKELRVGAATGINPEVADRFFKGLGFQPAGVLYLKPLGPLNSAS